MVNPLTPPQGTTTPIAQITKIQADSSRPEEAKEPALPVDKTDVQDEVDKLKKSRRDLKSFFAASTVLEKFARSLGAIGSFWGTVTGLLGGAPGGWVAVWAGAGAAFNCADGASLARYSAINRYLPGAVQGTLQTAQGVALMATVMGFGRIPAAIAAACFLGRLGYSLYESFAEGNGEKDKDKMRVMDTMGSKDMAQLFSRGIHDIVAKDKDETRSAAPKSIAMEAQTT